MTVNFSPTKEQNRIIYFGRQNLIDNKIILLQKIFGDGRMIISAQIIWS